MELTYRQVEETLQALHKVTEKTQIRRADGTYAEASPHISATVRSRIAWNLRSLKKAFEAKEEERLALVEGYFGDTPPDKAEPVVKHKFQKEYELLLRKTVAVELRKIPLVLDNPKKDETVICISPDEAPLPPGVIADLLGTVFEEFEWTTTK